MATPLQRFCLTAGRCQCRVAVRCQPPKFVWGRSRFSTSHLRQKEGEGPNEEMEADETALKDFSREELDRSFSQISTEPTTTKKDPRALEDSFKSLVQTYGRRISQVPDELRQAPPFRETMVVKPKPGLLNMGLKPSEQPEEDPEFEEDDISSLAHGELDQHREFRHYARLAAWEMPLLTKMAKPFVPPTKKEVLRFRYTTYMGEEHPAEKKVVLEFCAADMPDLTEVQRMKLKKLAGTRYNPETDIIKMSCEMFETQAQNKRYLGDLVDVLLREARDPSDTFEDIPLDTRHHPIRVKPKFPVEWRMTPERKAELEASRQQLAQADEKKTIAGAIVDGVEQIQSAFTRTALAADEAGEPQILMAEVQSPAKGRKLSRRG